MSALGHNNPPSDEELFLEDMASRHGEDLTKADELIAAALRLPVVDNPEAAEKVTLYIKQVTKQNSTLETSRKAEVEPHLAKQRKVNDFFKAVQEKLDAAKRQASKALNDYVQEEDRKRRAKLAEEAAAAQKKADELAAQAATEQNAGADELAETTLKQAIKADNQAARFTKASNTSAAGVRAEGGVTASLRKEWKGTITDLAALDLEKLRPYIGQDALQTALNKFVREGGRECAGAVIDEQVSSVVR